MMNAHFQAHNPTLSDLLPGFTLAEAGSIVIRNLCLDSRHLKTGDAFIAMAGTRVDGRQFIAKAVEAGAAAILVEADKDWQGLAWLGSTPVIAIDDLPGHVSVIAGRFYREPSKGLNLIGITGTNGKTTCSLLVAQLFTRLQQRAAVIGTLGYGMLDGVATAFAQQVNSFSSTGLTTPDPIAVQRILAELKNHGAQVVAMEVSSHSLQQKRVAGLQFATAVFTNLTQDHLDYHGDLAHYGNAKAQLLDMPMLRTAIINLDDAWAKSLLERLPAHVTAITYSTKVDADIRAMRFESNAQGLSAWVETPWGQGEVQTTLLGEFNLSNLLAVIASVCVQGFTLAQVLPHIPSLETAPGRMQSILLEAKTADIRVIVDYAHTPDALENTLNAIHQHKTGRVWTVFGCGGDRDKTKRPQMGRIAEQLSDYVIVTNDNPRSEDPATIAAEIVCGMKNPNGCLVIAERAQAIDFAVQQAKPGDVVLVAGKGHEDYQIFATQTLPFSDIKQTRLALERRMDKQAAQNREGAQS